MSLTRRDSLLMLPALLAAAGASRVLTPAAAAEPPRRGDRVLPSHIYRFGDLRPRAGEAGAVARAVLAGDTHSGYHLEMHETDLAPGAKPHPPHRHVHEEIFAIRRGRLDVFLNGQTTRIGPGSVVYVASNDLHGVVNPGPNHAEYFVIELGRDR